MILKQKKNKIQNKCYFTTGTGWGSLRFWTFAGTRDSELLGT